MAEKKEDARAPAKTTTRKSTKTKSDTKKTTAKKHAGGRPRIKIDKGTFENLCHFQCTLEEIAYWFKCSADTIERWCKREYNLSFADAYKKYSAGGKISLRRTQFKLAEKSASMAIFLGKQYLGQKDVIPEASNNTETDVNIYLPKKEGEE